VHPIGPQPPFAQWPVQHFDPKVGFYWYAQPATFVSQSVATHGSIEVIDRQNDTMDRVLQAREAEIRAAGGLLVFNDWRSVKTYDLDARARQRERMRARPAGYSRRTVIVVDPASRLLRMAIEAANLFATLTLQSRLELLTNIAHAVSRAELAAPPRGDAFPR
jgi:hypothetical protein